MKKNSLKKEKNSKVLENPSTKDLESLEKSTKQYSPSEKAENLWNAPNVIDFVETKLDIKLDDWQKRYITHEGNTVVRAGRQSGKSFAESLRVALFALLNKKTTTLIIASVDRQSIELLEKVKAHIIALSRKNIKGRPTFHKIELTNGSKIMAEPAGATGYGLRGFTVDKLVADEAHYIPDAVFTAVRPMLATTGGTLDLLSTPRGNEGFFYDCCRDKDFLEIHVTTEDVYKTRPGWTEEWRKERVKWIQEQRKTMTKLEFCQEYEAEFLDSLQQLFPRELIDSCILPPNSEVYYSPSETYSGGRHFLGVDLAGYGGAQNAFVTILNKGKISYIRNFETTERVKAWETVNHILALNLNYNYQKIGVDDGGLGTPILDYLLTHGKLKRKTIGLNNASREIDKDGKTKKLLGEDMYGNLKLMMEQGLIKFKNEEELIRSLTSVQFEVDKDTKRVKIHGKYDHLAEAMKRAAWLVKSKGLNIMAFC